MEGSSYRDEVAGCQQRVANLRDAGPGKPGVRMSDDQLFQCTLVNAR